MPGSRVLRNQPCGMRFDRVHSMHRQCMIDIAYKRRKTKMAEVLLCKNPCTLDSLDDIHDMYSLQLKHKPRTGPPILIPYRPYLHSAQPSTTDENIMLKLNHSLPKRDITDMAFDLGEENTVAIAEIAAGLRDYSAASAGAVTTVYGRRMQNFGAAVKRVQDALLKYRAVAKSDPAAASVAEQEVMNAYKQMQKGFQTEVNIVTSGIRRSRALTLTRPRRALEVARHSRRIAKLRVFDEVQATRLVRLSKYGKYLGNGLVVIDFGSRVNHIHDSYKAGENWYREMFVESTSFALSVSAGSFVADAGTYFAGQALAGEALACLIGATPAGWVLVIVGLGVAAAAAGTSIYLDKKIKENSGSWYDAIMKWINPK
jgi:hypothetical protein